MAKCFEIRKIRSVASVNKVSFHRRVSFWQDTPESLRKQGLRKSVFRDLNFFCYISQLLKLNILNKNENEYDFILNI